MSQISKFKYVTRMIERCYTDDVTDDKRMISQRCLNSKIVYPCSCAKARDEKLACPIHEFGKGYWTCYPMNGIPKFHKWKPLRKGLTPLWPTEGFKKNIQRWKKYVWKFCYFPIIPNINAQSCIPSLMMLTLKFQTDNN